MSKPINIEVTGRRGIYRPTGRVSFEQAVDQVAEAIREARAMDLAGLLVNTNGFTGVSPPSIFARHAMAVKWVESAGSRLHVAMVARPELIDPEKIGVIMAQNRGGSVDVFTSEAAALAWLDARIDGSR